MIFFQFSITVGKSLMETQVSACIIGVNLSEPHTIASVTAFVEVVCMSACLLVAMYHKF